MRTYARAIAGFNAFYQGVVGLLCVALPTLAATAFKVSGESPSTRALVRIIGGLLIANAFSLSMFAKAPEKNPSLPWLLLLGAGANVSADLLICSAGDMRFADLAVGIGAQALLAVGLVSVLRRREQSEPA